MLLRKMPDSYSTSLDYSTSGRGSSSAQHAVKPLVSLEDLVDQTEIKYGTLNTGIFVRLFQMSNHTVLSQVWRNMEKFKRQGYDVMTPTNELGIEKTRNERYAYILPNTIADYVVNRAPCDLTAVDQFLRTRGYGFAVKNREDPLLAELNIALDSLDAEGYLKRLYHKWWRLKGDCFKGAARRGGSPWVQDSENGATIHRVGHLALLVIWVVGLRVVHLLRCMLSL